MLCVTALLGILMRESVSILFQDSVSMGQLQTVCLESTHQVGTAVAEGGRWGKFWAQLEVLYNTERVITIQYYKVKRLWSLMAMLAG